MKNPKKPHSLEKPAATLIATATLLAGMGMPTAALAAAGTTPNPSASTSGTGTGTADKDQTNTPITWTLMGVTLTADDKGTLTLPDGQTAPAFDKRPDNASVQGSDGTTIPLTLADTAEEHPDLGVTTGTGTLTAEAKDGRPAVRVPATWTTGTRTTLSDGTPFTLKDGAWEASYGRTLTLKDDNEPPVRNIGLSDGSKHEITWGEPTLHDGKVVREGTASGEIQGQKWQATLTAERDTDHTGLTQAVAAARQAYDQGADEYTAASLENLADAIEQADELDRTGATDEAMDAMRDRLAEAVGNLDTITWKTDGTTFSHEKGQGYDGKAPDTADAAPGDTVALTSNDPTLGKLGSITIGRVQNDDPATLTDEDLGVARATGTAHYKGTAPNGNRTATWSQDYSYTLGKRVEATGPDGKAIGFTLGHGYLSATVTASLDQANQPKDADVTIDGRKAQVTWSGQVVHTTTTDTTTTYTRQGRVEGDVKVAGTDRTQHWIVYVSASRTEGHVAGLSLIQRKPDGTTSRHDISGFDPSRHEYAITMPADAVADQYTLGHTSAAGDKADVSEGDPVAPTLGANASRILKTTLNGVTYTVTVDFEKAKPTPSNPHARLNGLYVDLTGKAGKGALIDGWDPDVLDYTIRIGANDPGAYILPEAPSGVSVKAGDVTRAGYATTQYWTTRSADGQSRTYSVTVVRDHGTPTAEEAFTPGAAKDTDGQTPAASRDDTTLVSHGYLLDGEYHAVKATDYTIPEGGTFAYASKQGQIVQVSESKVRGMSWRYTLNILAPDGVTLANPAPAFTVTYLTRATHEAAITSIIVDGRAIDGFDPSKHEYTAQVDNIDHWTASADFDKSTGMGVTIHKDHAEATITATSADGLTKSTYTLKVSEKPLTLNRAGIDGATVEGLAHTGADTASMISVVAVLLAAGVACLAAGLTRRLHRGKRGDARTDGDADVTGSQDAE